MEHQTLAELIMLAFNEPDKLPAERRDAEAIAAAAVDERELLARATRMADEIERGNVLMS